MTTPFIVPTSTDVEPTSNEGIAHIVNFINGSDSITVHLETDKDPISIILELKNKVKEKYGHFSENLVLTNVDSTDTQSQWCCLISDKIDFELEVNNTTVLILPYHGCQDLHEDSTITLEIPCAILNKFGLLSQRYCYDRLKKYLIRITAERVLGLEGMNACFIRREPSGELSVNVRVDGLTYQQNYINNQLEHENKKCLMMIHELCSVDKYIENTAWCR